MTKIVYLTLWPQQNSQLIRGANLCVQMSESEYNFVKHDEINSGEDN